MRRCRSLELTLVLVLVTHAARAADPPLKLEARVHVDRGLEAYRDLRYEDAVRELSAAYKVDPRREILFNWAQAERLSGDCEAAVPLYQRFLDDDPPQAQEAQARRLIEKCKKTPPDPPKPVPAESKEPAESERRAGGAPPDDAPVGAVVDPWSDSQPATTTGPTSASPPPPSEAPFYHDVVGDALVAGGLVGLSVGVVYSVRSVASFDDAASAPLYQAYGPPYQEGRRQRTIGVVGLGLGGALLGAGIVRWVIVGRERTAPPAHQVGIAPVAGGAALVVGGAF